MKMRQLGANKTEVEFADSTRVLFSYETPVAAYVPSIGYVRTRTKYSRTTSKHINSWLDGKISNDVDQNYIDNLLT